MTKHTPKFNCCHQINVRVFKKVIWILQLFVSILLMLTYRWPGRGHNVGSYFTAGALLCFVDNKYEGNIWYDCSSNPWPVHPSNHTLGNRRTRSNDNISEVISHFANVQSDSVALEGSCQPVVYRSVSVFVKIITSVTQICNVIIMGDNISCAIYPISTQSSFPYISYNQVI